jgi:hypothetical protein
MIEVYALPTAKPYRVQAQYLQRINGQAQPLVTLENVVFYDKTGVLETGMLGIKYMVQISTSVLSGKPGLNDSIIIAGKEYKFMNPTIKRNPGFVPFFESEIKSTTK